MARSVFTVNHRTTEDPARAAESLDPLEMVMRYHRETKHHFSRYARSLGYMDWANQPDPFRRYQGSAFIPLPLLKPDDAPLSPFYEDLYRPGAIAGAPVKLLTFLVPRVASRHARYLEPVPSWLVITYDRVRLPCWTDYNNSSVSTCCSSW